MKVVVKKRDTSIPVNIGTEFIKLDAALKYANAVESGGMAKAVQDIPPYMIAEGSPACLRSVNQVGLARRGFSEEDIRAIRFAYRKLFLYKEDKTKLEDKLVEVLGDEKYGSNPCIAYLVDFLRSSQRGFAR